MLGGEFERFFRTAAFPLKPGDRVDLCGITVDVLAVNATGPTRVAFTFDRPLEDPTLCFLMWRDKGLRKATLPGIGQVMELGPSPST